MPDAFPLIRAVNRLRDGRTYDVLVIGGGIYGAWCAYDAARRGLSVALVEQTDWAAGTSSASSKLIHGGLRYLEHFEFRLVRHALTERRVLARLAPHLVRPMNFVLPVWGGARVGMLRLAAGLMLYDGLSWGRQPVQRHKRYRAERLLRRYPYLSADGLRGGFRYGDCQEDDARLVLEVVAAAQGAGAHCANRMRAEHLLEDGARIVGARLHDSESGVRFELRARSVIGAAGPWVRELTGTAAPPVKLVKGTHLVLPQLPHTLSAFLLTAPQDGRVFFLIPWYHRTLVGTTEEQVDDADSSAPTERESRYLLAAAHAWMPGLNWGMDDVIARFAGTRALQAQDTETLAAVTREFEITQPRPGLLLPIGGKFTTARHDAARVVDRACGVLGVSVRCTTEQAPLPGAPSDDFGAWQADALARLQALTVDDESARWLTLRFGRRVQGVIDRIRDDPHLGRRIVADSPFVGAEIAIALDDEMARGTEDVLRRRIPLRILSREQTVAEARLLEFPQSES